MKSLTLTIFAVLASFVLLTHAALDDEQQETTGNLIENMIAELQQIQKRGRNNGCNSYFMDPINQPSWCKRKRSRVLPKFDEMEWLMETKDEKQEIISNIYDKLWLLGTVHTDN